MGGGKQVIRRRRRNWGERIWRYTVSPLSSHEESNQKEGRTHRSTYCATGFLAVARLFLGDALGATGASMSMELATVKDEQVSWVGSKECEAGGHLLVVQSGAEVVLVRVRDGLLLLGGRFLGRSGLCGSLGSSSLLCGSWLLGRLWWGLRDGAGEASAHFPSCKAVQGELGENAPSSSLSTTAIFFLGAAFAFAGTSEPQASLGSLSLSFFAALAFGAALGAAFLGAGLTSG